MMFGMQPTMPSLLLRAVVNVRNQYSDTIELYTHTLP